MTALPPIKVGDVIRVKGNLRTPGISSISHKNPQRTTVIEVIHVVETRHAGYALVSGYLWSKLGRRKGEPRTEVFLSGPNGRDWVLLKRDGQPMLDERPQEDDDMSERHAAQRRLDRLALEVNNELIHLQVLLADAQRIDWARYGSGSTVSLAHEELEHARNALERAAAFLKEGK